VTVEPATEKRIFDKLETISTDVATTATSIAVVEAKLPAMHDRGVGLDKRLRSVEARIWYAMGAVGLLAVVPQVIQRLAA